MSVRKRKWKTSKGESREAWIVDYKDQKGERVIKTFERKKEADAFASETAVEVRAGTHTPHSKSITVEAAGDLWITTGELNGLERTTVDAYKQHLRLHIMPKLSKYRLSELHVSTVRDFEDGLRNANSPAMVKKIMGSLGSILADAMERGHVNRNVVRELRSRRKRGKEKRAERRQKGKLRAGVDIPTPEEIRAITGKLTGRWRPLLLTAIFCGLRASELRGLRWADIDFERRELHVRQRADRYNQAGAPKSEAGERTIPVTPIVLNTLKEWRLAGPKSDLDLVFPTGAGKVEYHSNIVHRGLEPVQVAAGVTVPVLDADSQPVLGEDGKPAVRAKYPGLHALRHFYASWCINRRVDGGLELPAKVVQERLGHASIQLTLDVYGHLFPRGDDAAELEAAERSLIG
jgi:integrase